MKSAQLTTAVALAVLALSSPAQAELHFNGFATVAAGMTLDDDETFEGYDDSLTFEPDSVFGLQASADLGDKLSVTGQLVARGSREFKMKAEWAYISYDVTPEIRINAGRQRIPLYVYSDFLDVGYAYHWIRPPQSVYSAPISSVDGVSVLYNTFFGDLQSQIQIIGGSYSETDYPFADPATGVERELGIELKDYWGAVWALTYDWLTLRMSYHKTQLSVSNLLPAPLDIDRDDLTFAGLGLVADYGNIIFVSEARKYGYSDSYYPEEDAYYLSAGYRFGSVTPYFTVERYEAHLDEQKIANLGTDFPGLTPVQAATIAAGLNYGLDRDEHAYTLGARYNFHPSAALKLEWTHRDDHRDVPQDYQRGADVIATAVNVVF